jgi:hypothetical protein
MLPLLSEQVQLAAYKKAAACRSKRDDDGVLKVFNTLSATDAAAVARLNRSSKVFYSKRDANNLLGETAFYGSLESMKLVISKGATKETVHHNHDCFGYWLLHSEISHTDILEGLALLIVIGMPIASGWINFGAQRAKKWMQSDDSEIRPVLDALLSTLNFENDDTAALVEQLITSLDIKGREKDGQVVDASVCQFDSVERLMPNNAPDWLVALVATMFSMQYEQGGAAIAQEMRPIIIDHFNFDIPA